MLSNGYLMRAQILVHVRNKFIVYYVVGLVQKSRRILHHNNLKLGFKLYIIAYCFQLGSVTSSDPNSNNNSGVVPLVYNYCYLVGLILIRNRLVTKLASRKH